MNKVLSFILNFLCINTANSDYASGADSELKQMQAELALKPNDAKLLNKLGLAYYDQGKYEQAEPLFLHSFEIREKSLGKDHPDVTLSLNYLALLLGFN